MFFVEAYCSVQPQPADGSERTVLCQKQILSRILIGNSQQTRQMLATTALRDQVPQEGEWARPSRKRRLQDFHRGRQSQSDRFGRLAKDVVRQILEPDHPL